MPIATNSNSNSYPPTKPSDNFTIRVTAIISIMKSAAVILVKTPTRRNIPPITSSRPIGTTSSGGIPTLPKKPCVLATSPNFGNPCTITEFQPESL